MNIVVIGSMNMDYVLTTDNLPKKGETIHAIDFKTSIGGKGANQAFAARKLGADVVMIGSVGNDDNGRKIINRMNEVGIDTSRIEIVNTETGNAMITVDNNGNNTIIVYGGANKCVNKEIIDKNEDAIIKADFVIFQLEIPIETVEYGIELAKKHNTKVILNPAPAKIFSDNILRNVDIITPNETELVIISGENDLKLGARKLLESGVKEVIVTIGEKGSYYLSNEKEILSESIKVKAIDTTAAGDSFNGALAVAICEGKCIEEALEFSNVVGALTTTKSGAEKSLPYREEVNKILEIKYNK